MFDTNSFPGFSKNLEDITIRRSLALVNNFVYPRASNDKKIELFRT